MTLLCHFLVVPIPSQFASSAENDNTALHLFSFDIGFDKQTRGSGFDRDGTLGRGVREDSSAVAHDVLL